MAFSEIDAAIIGAELTARFRGFGVSDVLGAGDELFLSFKKVGILIKARPPNQRIHAASPPQLPRHPWRKFLKGARFLEAEPVPGDRIVILKFEKVNPLGESEELSLYAELTGKYGNAVLVRGEVILDALRRVSHSESRHRVLQPGLHYQLPPRKPVSAFDLEGEELWDYLERVQPCLGREARLRGWEADDIITEALTNPSPCVYIRGQEPLCPSPFHLEHLKDADRVDYAYYSEALEAFYNAIEGLDEAPQPQERKDLERRRERMLKKAQELEAEAQRLYELGSLLMANLWKIKPGDEEVELEGRRVKLDPRLTPGQNAEAYFTRGKKLRKAAERLRKKAEALSPKPKAQGQEPQPSKPYLEFESPGGFKVLVGKSAAGNDLVTFKLAGPEDWWFHVKDAPGAHVVLKSGRQEVSEEDLLFAARLALEHSSAASSGKGLVIATKKRYVAKPKGAKPGLVVVLRELRTIGVRL